MASPKTRLDKVVQLRERVEDDALVSFARARASLEDARQELAGAVCASRADARAAGPVELFLLDEHAHRRALQAVRAAETALQQATRGELTARDGWLAARQEADAVRQARERRVAELLGEAARRERRDADEVATLRFNVAR
ncbi:MAG: flagellar export protein FliJ [Anaeromyxobacteraceae bacterium]